MEISTAATELEFGDPLVVSLKVRFDEPHVSPDRSGPSGRIDVDGLAFRVQRGDDEASLFRVRLPVTLDMADANGLEYEAKVVVFCDLYKEKKQFVKRVIFDKPGAYTFTIVRATKASSNTISLSVKGSDAGQRALALLDEPEDLAFLIGGLFKSAKAVSHLEQVVNECEGTVMARWAAARLALSEWSEVEKKYSNQRQFRSEYREGKVTEPLVNQACLHFAKASELSDEFPIREEVLYHGISAEVVRGDFAKALSYANELGKKYPKGRYGKGASRLSEVIVDFEKDG
jgi:hypothetical protein